MLWAVSHLCFFPRCFLSRVASESSGSWRRLLLGPACIGNALYMMDVERGSSHRRYGKKVQTAIDCCVDGKMVKGEVFVC